MRYAPCSRNTVGFEPHLDTRGGLVAWTAASVRGTRAVLVRPRWHSAPLALCIVLPLIRNRNTSCDRHEGNGHRLPEGRANHDTNATDFGEERHHCSAYAAKSPGEHTDCEFSQPAGTPGDCVFSSAYGGSSSEPGGTTSPPPPPSSLPLPVITSFAAAPAFDGGRQSRATGGFYFTYAKEPTGPWAAPQLIFNSTRDNALGRLHPQSKRGPERRSQWSHHRPEHRSGHHSRRGLRTHADRAIHQGDRQHAQDLLLQFDLEPVHRGKDAVRVHHRTSLTNGPAA